MNPDKKASRDYRFIVFSVVAAYIAVMLFSEFYYGTYGRIIKSLGILPLPYFADLKALLTGLDAVRSGLDPYSSAEANTWLLSGSFNYPVIWTWLAVLPFLKVANSFILGVVLLVMFFPPCIFSSATLTFLSRLPIVYLLFRRPLCLAWNGVIAM